MGIQFRDKNHNKRSVIGNARGSYTGATIEAILTNGAVEAKVVFPAGSLEVGDCIRIEEFRVTDYTGGGTNNHRIRFGNHATFNSNTAIFSVGSSSHLIWPRIMNLVITSATTAILYPSGSSSSMIINAGAAATVTTNFDIATENTLWFTGTLGNASNTSTLHSGVVEVIKGD